MVLNIFLIIVTFQILNFATETFSSQNVGLKAGWSQVELSDHLFPLCFHCWVKGTVLIYLLTPVDVHMATHTCPEYKSLSLKDKKDL